MRVGIIRCQSYSQGCSAASCFRAAKSGSGHFAETAEIVGLDTCGGCPRGDAGGVVKRAKRLQDAGAEQIHLSNCLVGPCPWADMWEAAIKKETGVPVVRGTH